MAPRVEWMEEKEKHSKHWGGVAEQGSAANRTPHFILPRAAGHYAAKRSGAALASRAATPEMAATTCMQVGSRDADVVCMYASFHATAGLTHLWGACWRAHDCAGLGMHRGDSIVERSPLQDILLHQASGMSTLR